MPFISDDHATKLLQPGVFVTRGAPAIVLRITSEFRMGLRRTHCHENEAQSAVPTIRPLRELRAIRKPYLATTNISHVWNSLASSGEIATGLAVETNFKTIVQWCARTASQGDRCIRTLGGSVARLEAAQGNEPSSRARGLWQMLG